MPLLETSIGIEGMSNAIIVIGSVLKFKLLLYRYSGYWNVHAPASFASPDNSWFPGLNPISSSINERSISVEYSNDTIVHAPFRRYDVEYSQDPLSSVASGLKLFAASSIHPKTIQDPSSSVAFRS